MPPRNNPAPSSSTPKPHLPHHALARTQETRRPLSTEPLHRSVSPVITGETLSTIYRVLPSSDGIANSYSVILVTVSATDQPTTFQTSTTPTQNAAQNTGDPTDSPEPEAKKSNGGAIAGGVVGGLLASVLLALLAFFLIRFYKSAAGTEQEYSSPPNSIYTPPNPNPSPISPSHSVSHLVAVHSEI